jgi:hypothetical protein
MPSLMRRPGQDHLGVVAHRFGLGGEVVGVHADAVAAHQTGGERQEVPLGAGGRQHVPGADAQPVEDERQLVHERDVEVALGVLDHLGGLGHPDGGGAVNAGGDDAPVGVGHPVQGLGVLARDHLHDALERVFLVARVDALRRVTQPEVPALFKARHPGQDGSADLLGHAGIDGGLEHHHRAGGQHPAHGLAGGDHRAEIRLAVLVDRGGHRHHEERDAPEILGIGGIADGDGGKFLGGDLARVVVPLPEGAHPAFADVEAHRVRVVPRKPQGHGQTHVAEADHTDSFAHAVHPDADAVMWANDSGKA